MQRRVKLTKLERLPRALVYWTIHIVGIPLFVAMVPFAFAWVNALEVAEAVSAWMNRKFWN